MGHVTVAVCDVAGNCAKWANRLAS